MTALSTYAIHLATGKMTQVVTPDLSAAFRDGATDKLLVAEGADVHALFTGTVRAVGTWTKRMVLPAYTSFSWMQVMSDFVDADGAAASVTITVVSEDGTTLSTSVVTSRTPVRLVPFYEKEAIVTVSSKARVTEVAFAATMSELRQV